MSRTFVIALLLLASCSAGPTKIDETYYLGASNGEENVYYRVHLTGETQFGVAEFREGWFPAQAVDALFGDVSLEGMSDALALEEKLRKNIATALVRSHANYLAAATDPKVDADDLDKLLDRHLDSIARVQLFPNQARGRLRETKLMEYDPKENLVTAHSGDKLVMVLSSNPDEVIGKLTSLVEDAQTEKLFHQLAAVVVEREEQRSNEVVVEGEEAQRRDEVLASALRSLGEDLGDEAIASDKGEVLGALDAVITYIQGVSR